MRAPRPRPSKANDFIWDLLTFERLMTGPITHLIYWAGLAIVWRGLCEFYVAVFRIADDLRALRLAQEAAGQSIPPRPSTPAPGAATGGLDL